MTTTSTSDVRRVVLVMGTVVSIDVRRVADREAALAAVATATAWLHRVDDLLSTYKPESALSRLRRGELIPADGPPELAEALTLGRRCQLRTGGAFDLAWRGDRRPDPTGVVKGWAAEHASRLLASAGFGHHAVNAAGDVRLRGRPVDDRLWSVGIAHPHAPGRLVAVVPATDAGVATSGTAERGDHVIDTRTGQPSLAVASATVVGPDLGPADGYATAAVSCGWDAVPLLEGLDAEGWSSLLVGANGRIWTSPGFRGDVHPDGILPEPGGHGG